MFYELRVRGSFQFRVIQAPQSLQTIQNIPYHTHTQCSFLILEQVALPNPPNAEKDDEEIPKILCLVNAIHFILEIRLKKCSFIKMLNLHQTRTDFIYKCILNIVKHLGTVKRVYFAPVLIEEFFSLEINIPKKYFST